MKPLKQFIIAIKVILCLIFLPVVLWAQTNQTVTAGSATTAANFPAGTCFYNWTNDNPSIGLAGSGTGSIASFTAINNGSTPITATITATPIAPGYAYVPNSVSGTISVVNATSKVVTSVIPVLPNPVGVTISPDAAHVYVTHTTQNSITFINTITNAVETVIQGAIAPYGITITPDGNYIYVANSGTSNIWKIKTSGLPPVVLPITVGLGPVGIIMSPDGTKVYTVNYNAGTVSVVNTSTDLLLNNISIGAFPYFGTITPNGAYLYVTHRNSNTVSVINTANNTLQTVINVGSSPNGIVASPDGSRIYVANTVSNTVSVISTATNTVTNIISAGNSPAGLSLSPDGGLLYVTNNLAAGTVSIVNTSNFATVSTVSVGANPVGYGNFVTAGVACNNVPVTFTITVNAATAIPVITTSGTPSSVNTSYGTSSSPTSFNVSGTDMTAGILVTPPPAFEVSLDGTNYSNTVTVSGTGTIASKQVSIRLKKTTAAGTYSGPIVLSSPGASDVNVAMPASTVSRLTINVFVYGSKDYGDVINDFVATTNNFNFNVINAGLKNGETVASLDITLTGGNKATDPPNVYNNAIHAANITGANGFSLNNYTINYQDGPLTVNPAPLTITAKNVSKTFGTTLTNVVGSTEFTTNGLQNSETISSVNITYGNGATANAPIGTYTGSVTASGAVGGNGFVTTNYDIVYTAGNIIVNAAGPSITVSGVLQPLTTVYGTPSSPTSFNVSGTNLTAGILVTPPAGFEVSTDMSTYSNTVTVGAAGNVASTTVYIRLKQTTFAGNYFGNIALTSAGAADVNQTMPTSTVTPAPLLITANDVSKVYGNILTGGTGSTAFVATGLQNGETVGTVTISYNNGAGATANAGTYPASVVPSAPVGGTFTLNNYTPTYQGGNITVTPALLTVTADNQSKIYGDVNPALTVTYSGFVNSDGPAQLTTQPTAVTAATQASVIGTYPITVSGGNASNYNFTYVNGVLTVNPVPNSPITIPNTFTPNGDGINDTWNINNLITYAKTTVEVVNRYGTRVYFSNGYSVPWDGKYKGTNVPDGTYYYIITGVNAKPLTGYVAVIR